MTRSVMKQEYSVELGDWWHQEGAAGERVSIGIEYNAFDDKYLAGFVNGEAQQNPETLLAKLAEIGKRASEILEDL
jgi:hypothetical protein